MKRFLLIATIALSLSSMAQTKTAKNYPVLANPNLTTTSAEATDANQLAKNEAVRFSVSIINPSQTEVVKAGSCTLQIELGNKVRIAHKDFMRRMSFQEHFTWSVTTDDKGVIWLTGKLIADLPADFAGSTSIDLQCAETGTSSIKAQWISSSERAKIGALNTVDFTIKKNKPKE